MVRLFKPQQFHVALVATVLLLSCGSSFSLANNQKPQGSSNLEFGVVGSSGPVSGGLKGSSTASKIVHHQQQTKNSGSTSNSNKSQQTFMDSLRTKSKLVSNQNQIQNPNVKVASVSYGTILSKIAASGYSVATPSSTTKLDSGRNYGTNYGTLNNNKKILLQKNHDEIFPDEILSQKLREYVESTKKEEDDKIKQQKKNQTSSSSSSSFSYSAYGGSTGGFEESENSEENLLGVETTSINPFESSETTEDTFGNTPAPILAVRSRSNSVQDQTKSRKQIEIEDDHNGLHQSKEDDGLSFLNAKRIKAAVQTKHTFEYRPVEFANLDRAEPKIIEVEAKSIPLEIHFKSASSRIKLVQSHQSGELNEIERTSSEEEPQRLLHLVRKPIIQEVHEIITPYRRIVQEIRPVMEEIRTVVSHEKESSRSDRFQSKTNEKLQSANQTQVDRFQGQKLSPARQQKQLLAKQQQKQETVQKTQTQVVSKQTSQAARTTQRPSLAPVQEKRQQQQQQQRLEQKHIKDFGMKASHSNGYVPSYSFPLEGTGTTTTTTSSTKSTDFWDHQIDGADARSATDVDVDDQGTVEIIDNNGDSAIIPAKLMEDMIVSYQASIQSQKLRHQLRDQSVQLSQQQQQQKNNQPKLAKNSNNSHKQFEKQQLATTSNSDSASNFGWNYSGFRDFDSNNQQQRRNQQPQQQQQLNQPQSAQSYGSFNQNNLYRSTNSNTNSNTNQNQQLQQSSSNQHWRVAPYNAHIEFNHFNHHPQQPQQLQQQANHNQNHQPQFNHHHQQANQQFNHFNHHNNNNHHPNHQFNRY